MWGTKTITVFIYTLISLTTFINAAIGVINLQNIIDMQRFGNATLASLLGLLVVLNAFSCVITGFAAWDSHWMMNEQKKEEPKELPKIEEVFEPGSSEPRNTNAEA